MKKIEKDKSEKANKQNNSTVAEDNKKQNSELHNSDIYNRNNDISENTSSESNANTNSKTSNPNDFSIDLGVLNEIGKASKMAMSSINYLISNITNNELKKDIVAIYSQYSNILHQVSEHFEKYGEIPDGATVYSKIMSFWGTKVNTKFNNSNSHIAEIMIQGTIMGIIKCTKIQNSNLSIAESTKTLLESFNQFQKDNVTKLSKYL